MEPRESNHYFLGSRAGTALSAFVLLTLVALVGVPVLVQSRVTALRQEIEQSEPARTLIRRLQLNLVRAILVQNERSLQPTGALEAEYDSLRAVERSLLTELRPVAVDLGPPVVAALEDVERVSSEWHRRVEVEVEERAESGVNLLDSPDERRSFEAVIRSVAALDSTILERTAATRAQIASAEERGLRITFLLGLLALLVAASVVVLWHRTRHYARQAERRRIEAEVERESAERRRLQTEEALAEAARANEARARLLRGVTHDVKNPLGAAKGYAELLAMGIKAPLHPEQQPLVEGIQRSLDGALAILTDLLELSRSESGGLTIRKRPADLVLVTRQAVEEHQAAAEAAGHSLTFEPPPGSVMVYTDPERTHQILGNLLSNAIKYTPPPGRITVGVCVSEAGQIGAPGEWAVVRVTDDGPGIPDDEAEAVFEEFTRLGDRNLPEGHGLGLAIARRLARLMGGELTLDTTTTQGASFVLLLPRNGDQPEETRPDGAFAVDERS